VITKRLEPVMKQKYGYELDKGRVVGGVSSAECGPKRFDENMALQLG
jgi:hypothetical protein